MGTDKVVVGSGGRGGRSQTLNMLKTNVVREHSKNEVRTY